MKVSLSVAAAAVVLALASLLVLVGETVEMFSAVDIARHTGQPFSDLVNARVDVLFAFPVVFSLLGVVAAVGLLGSREWGRRTALFLATVPVALYSMLVIVRPAFLFADPAGRTPFAMGDLAFPVCVYALVLFVPLSLWWLILLTRKGTRSQFETHGTKSITD